MSTYISQIERVREVTRQVKALTATLDADLLFTRPQPETWSVGELIEHLIVSNGLYHAGWDAHLSGKHSKSLWEMLPGQGIWGSQLKTMMKQAEKKYKHPEAFTPVVTHGDATVVDRFEVSQNQLVAYFEKLAKLPPSTTITSPAGAFVTYSLADCVEIITAHEERHLAQIRRKIDELDGMKAV